MEDLKVTKLKKEKKNIYRIILDNQEEIECYDDLIVKYSLIPKKEISKKELEIIKKENQDLESYYLALNYISKRMRSKKELNEYLKKKNYANTTIEQTMLLLEEKGYLNEEIYIESYISDNFRFTSNGPYKIQKELEELGLNNAKILEKLDGISKNEWLEKLERLFKKKVSSSHKDGTEKWKIKCEMYFHNLGYPKEWIKQIASTFDWKEDQTKLEKEYQKQKQKWSKKFQGNELNFQIKRKLYEKGYNKEVIEKFLIEKIDH